jgi:hypothetical protein
LIGTLLGPPPGIEGFATGFSFDTVDSLVALAAGFESVFVALPVIDDTFRVIFPSPEEGLTDNFCLPETLFSFSQTAGDLGRTAFFFLSSVSGSKTRPRVGGSFLGLQTSRFACGGFSLPKSHPMSSSDNAGGDGANLTGTPKTALSNESWESPSLESKMGDKVLLASAFGGVVGESANISIRLRGLGRAGEYACTILWAKGFATGKGRRSGAGVLGSFVPRSSLGGETSTTGGESSILSFTGGSS